MPPRQSDMPQSRGWTGFNKDGFLDDGGNKPSSNGPKRYKNDKATDSQCYKKIEKYFNNQYLTEAIPEDVSNDLRPVVQKIHVARLRNEDCDPEIIAIHNGLGNDLINQLIALYSQNDIFFHKGRKGRTNTHIRAVTNQAVEDGKGNHAFIQVGKQSNSVLYGCEEAAPLEKALISKVNDVIGGALKARHGTNFVVNNNSILINASNLRQSPGYGLHDDTDETVKICGPNDPYDRTLLPPNEQCVTTFTISFMGRKDITGKPIQVTWCYKESPTRTLAKITGGRDFCHLQGKHLQSGDRAHQVQIVPDAPTFLPSDWRIVMSFRCIVLPTVNTEAWKLRFNVSGYQRNIQVIKPLENRDNMISNVISAMQNPFTGVDSLVSFFAVPSNDDQQLHGQHCYVP